MVLWLKLNSIHVCSCALGFGEAKERHPPSLLFVSICLTTAPCTLLLHADSPKLDRPAAHTYRL